MNFILGLIGMWRSADSTTRTSYSFLIASFLFLAVVIGVPFVSKMKDALGFDTVNNMKIERTQLQEEVKGLKEVVKATEEQKTDITSISEIKIDTVKSLSNEIKRVGDTFEGIKHPKAKPVVIKAKTVKPPAEPQGQLVNGISSENIDKIWTAYEAAKTFDYSSTTQES